MTQAIDITVHDAKQIASALDLQLAGRWVFDFESVGRTVWSHLRISPSRRCDIAPYSPYAIGIALGFAAGAGTISAHLHAGLRPEYIVYEDTSDAVEFTLFEVPPIVRNRLVWQFPSRL